MAALTLFLRVWQPSTMWLSMSRNPALKVESESTKGEPIATIFQYQPEEGIQITRADTVKAWLPLVILSIAVFLWGIPQFKTFLDGIFNPKLPVPRPGQAHPASSAPGAGPSARTGGLRAQLIVGYRHRYPGRRDSQRFSDGLFVRLDWRGSIGRH